MAGKPKCILLFSGKRKSGKDYVTDLLHKRLGSDLCSILRLSGPLKRQYAKVHNLDYDRLLDASHYKEKYRVDMIQWGEDKRKADPGFFCRLVAKGPGSEKPIWIISDARRKTDFHYFSENYPECVLTVRVQADVEVRQKRGWVFTPGVDDAESECDLDDGVSWDLVIDNNGCEEQLSRGLENILAAIKPTVS